MVQQADQRAADKVVSELEAKILSGTLADGSTLPPERDLMTAFGTSRTVVREAISKLSQRGLLETKPRHRPIVSKPNLKTVFDTTDTIVKHMISDEVGIFNLHQTRIFIEAGLVRHAAQYATRDDIVAMKVALTRNENSIEDTNAFYASDLDFHRTLYVAFNNPIFPAIFEGLASWLGPHWVKAMVPSVERNKINFAHHKAIYDSILERDPETAEKALRAHLMQTWDFLKDTF